MFGGWICTRLGFGMSTSCLCNASLRGGGLGPSGPSWGLEIAGWWGCGGCRSAHSRWCGEGVVGALALTMIDLGEHFRTSGPAYIYIYIYVYIYMYVCLHICSCMCTSWAPPYAGFDACLHTTDIRGHTHLWTTEQYDMQFRMVEKYTPTVGRMTC